MFKKIGLFSLFIVTSFSIIGCRNDSEDKKYIGTINNEASFCNYLGYTSSCSEKGTSTSRYFTWKIIIYSLDDNYYFEDLKVCIYGDKKSLHQYPIPTSGNVELSVDSQVYASEEAAYLTKLLGGKINAANGKVYKKSK